MAKVLFFLLPFCPLSGEIVGFCQNIHHQQLWHPLSIKICYESEEGALDPALLKQCAARFLNLYPNEKDYWEIMNVKMAACLLQKYPSLGTLEIEIAVSPDDYVPFYRKSCLIYRNGLYKEFFSFLYEKPLQFEVIYVYKKGIQPEEYPDFLLLYRALDQFATEMLDMPWNIIRPLLIQHLHDQFPMIAELDLQI